jgi:ABC-type multidrug transport system fused ATPase/permease subunit
VRVFWRLLGFLRPYRGRVALSLVLAAVATGVGALIPFLVGLAVDDVGDGADRLWPLAGAIVAAGLVRLVFSVARRLVAGHVSLGVEYDLRNRMYSHLQSLELGFFDGQQTGQLMSRSTVDLQSVRFFLGYGLVFILQALVTVLVAAVIMLAVNPLLAALALAPLPLIVAFAFRYGKRNRPAQQEVQQRIAELTAEAEENVSGVGVVKAFAQEGRQLARFGHRVGRVFSQSMVSTRIRAFYNPLLGFLPSVGLAALLLVGGRQAASGQISAGEFVAFYGYVLMLSGPLRMLGIALGMAQRAVASGARVFELLDREPRLASPPGAPPLPAGQGRVELQGVAAAYEGSQPVLRDLDLTVEPGSTVAIVGATGAGKSTLVGLVPRLYDPVVGTVLVDGADVRTVDLESLRGSVAVVSDDAFLFSATVRENIAYAVPDASAEDVEEAARRAGAHEFITALPEGYDTLVGERGITLSGGQRQRIAIARALIRDARILVLDDATSSVDPAKEAEIREGLADPLRGRTALVIGHRLSTIQEADEVVVLDGGTVAARGSHEDLIGSSPLYREIVSADGRRPAEADRETEAVGA